MKRSGGFTLFELLVVLVLVSLMTALAAPRLVGSLSRLGARTSAQKVSAALRMLRSKAATEKKTYLAVFEMDKGALYFKRPDSGVSGSDGPEAAAPQKRFTLSEGVRFEKGIPVQGDATPSGEFLIAFFPGGGSSGGTVVLTGENDRRYAVSADLITGAIRVAEAE